MSEHKKSLTMLLYYHGEKDAAVQFAAEMESSGTADAIRAEPGNLQYEYFTCLKDPQTVLLVDSWADQEALDVHHASPMMSRVMELREKYDLHMRAQRLASDESGMTEEDRKFMKP